jgi:hypothetical protein
MNLRLAKYPGHVSVDLDDQTFAVTGRSRREVIVRGG